VELNGFESILAVKVGSEPTILVIKASFQLRHGHKNMDVNPEN